MNTLQKSLIIAAGAVLWGSVMGTMYAFPSAEKTEVRSAIEASDYSLLSDESQTKISEEKFEQMIERKATHQAVRDAIDAGDYSLVPTAAQEKISEEKFNEMLERNAQKDAVQSAIEAGDYEAFKNAAGDKKLEKVSTEEEFNALVERKQTLDVLKEKMEVAVQNNDFASFQSIISEKQETMESFRSDDRSNKKVRTEPTTEQLQERFDSAVQYYAENGELPQKRNKWKKGKRGQNQGFGWNRK